MESRGKMESKTKITTIQTKMPSKKVSTAILGSNYYHIFNRGINRQKVFFTKRNYFYFLRLLDEFLTDYISILAYSLMPNHFHLVIKVNELIEISIDSTSEKKMKLQTITNDEEIGKWVSNQFRRLFISYSMAINRQEGRTGSLFDKNFKRLEIIENAYLKYVIYYTHFNPEKHGFCSNYFRYEYSSYKALTMAKSTKIDRQLVYEIFEGKDAFQNYHSWVHSEREFLMLEK
jgi:putative transposase